MIERALSELILRAAEAAASELGLEEVPRHVEVTRPRQKEHGDYATNLALALGASVGRNPREVAEVLRRHFPPSDLVTKVEVAGPGFLNLFLAHGWLYGVLEQVTSEGPAYGRGDIGGGERVQVEFVSANPTGPLHVGSARNAVVGDSVARLLEATGHRVEREYYVNDVGRQIDLFAASLQARYLQQLGREAEVPEEGYGGTHLVELAGRIARDLGEALEDLPSDERLPRLRDEGIRRVLAGIRATLGRMGIAIDVWFHESTLHAEARIEETVALLRQRDLAYDSEGAVWFRSQRFGDEKDRVLIRANGEPTYFAADCAYARVKFERGFDRLIYVWGADHHGTVKRLKGAAEGLGLDPEKLEFVLYQLVNLFRAGQPVKMSKRTGDVVTLDELLDEVGPDAARYTLASRSVDTPLDFDIELVKRHTLDNPVFYVQYAHARIASVLSFARERGVELQPLEKIRAEELVHETELDLLRKIADLPELIENAARLRAPYRLARYAEELAAGFHRFYTECRVVTEDADVTQARLHLSAATKQVIANVLALLGVSAPESMERLEERG